MPEPMILHTNLRNNMGEWTDAECAIQGAMDDVETMGADPLLTDAVTLLGSARQKVAMWILAEAERQAAKAGA